MTWQQKLICQILLIIAKMVADPALREELHSLQLGIGQGRLSGDSK